MSIIYHCDRCGADNDAFTREVTIVPLYDDTTTEGLLAPGRVLHRCGYCSSHLRVFLAGEGVQALHNFVV